MINVRRIPLLALTLLLSAGPRRDVDVAVPPGTPLDWTRSIPVPTPRGTPMVPTGRMTGGGGDVDTVAVPRGHDTVIPSSYGAIRILTWDLTSEVPWTPPKPDTTVDTGGMGPWPPRVPDSLYWMSQGVFLRVMLHPLQVSEAESHQYLLEIGDPARKAAEAAQSETSISKFADAVLKDLGDPSKSRPTAPADKDPMREELLRFVMEQLVAGYPHDPDLTFGRRLFVLGSDGGPFVEYFTESDHDLLRRNAVLALGRYATLDVAGRAMALLSHSDPVTRARAVAILRDRRYAPAVDALKDRLNATQRLPEQCAIVHALGLIGKEEAAVNVMAIGRRNATNGDILMAVLPALARIDPQEEKTRGAVRRWVEGIEKKAASDPKSFDPKHGAPSRQPDVPDEPGARGRIIEQMCELALVRLKGGGDAVLGRLNKAKPRRVSRSQFQNEAVQGFEPPTWHLLCDTLPACGDAGVKALEAIVEDATCEPGLRTYALANLPKERRHALAEKFATQAADEISIYSFEMLDREKHAKVEEISRARLAGALGSPAEQYAVLMAVKALGKRDKLEVKDLEPLLKRLDVSTGGDSGESDRAVMERLVGRLVDAAVSELGADEGRARMDALLDEAIARKTNSGLTESTRKNYQQRVLDQMETLARNKKNAAVVKAVADGILRTVMPSAGFGGGAGEVTFDPVIPLAETVLLELGRTRDEKAPALLKDVMARASAYYRAVACLGLASTGRRDAADVVFPILSDKDGFARFCAYAAIKSLTGADHYGRWLYGDESQRAAAVAAYRQWLQEHP